jgi:hypothetical protein
MAILEKGDQGWLIWAIELMKRGLKPIDDIAVHGPHSHTPFIWGEAECDWYSGELCFDVKFRTVRSNSIWDVRSVRVRSKNDSESFPILKVQDLPAAWRKKIKSLRAELQKSKEAWTDTLQETKKLRKKIE